MAEATLFENVRKQAESRLHTAQDTVKDWVEELRKDGHKALLVTLGAAGTTQDTVADLLKWTNEFLDKSAERGQKVEDEALKEARRYWKQGRKRVEDVEAEIEHRMKAVVDRLEFPTRDKMQNLTGQVEQIEAKVKEQATELQEAAERNLPIADYSKLNAREVLNRLADMTISELHAIRDFESLAGKRSTVLRELNRRIEAMPIPDYDDMTVEQITAQLETLDPAKLTVIAQYERAHGNRVGVLQGIEAHLHDLEMMPA